MILRKIRTFWRLGQGVRRMALEAILLPPLVQAGFRLAGVPRTKARLARWAGRVAGSGNDSTPLPGLLIAQALRMQRIVAKSLGIGGTCLVRSLVLQAMLRRRGLKTELRIGVRKLENVAEGHAWVEYEGKPINETPELTATYILFEGAAGLDTWRPVR